MCRLGAANHALTEDVDSCNLFKKQKKTWHCHAIFDNATQEETDGAP
jgi:hypothetical protein